MKALFLAPALIFLGACASTQVYGPASKPGAAGYQTQRIEPNRFNVSYTARDAVRSRELALLRAAEVTLKRFGSSKTSTAARSSASRVCIRSIKLPRGIFSGDFDITVTLGSCAPASVEPLVKTMSGLGQALRGEAPQPCLAALVTGFQVNLRAD